MTQRHGVGEGALSLTHSGGGGDYVTTLGAPLTLLCVSGVPPVQFRAELGHGPGPVAVLGSRR